MSFISLILTSTMNPDLKLNFPAFPMQKKVLPLPLLLCDYLKFLMLKRFNNNICHFFVDAFHSSQSIERINEKRFSF